jgi:hypothetical protein
MMWWPKFLRATRQTGVSMSRQNHRAPMVRKRWALRPALEQLESRDLPSVSFHVGGQLSAYSSGVAVGDFSNDGIPDVAVTSGGTVGAYPGKGDGTFGDLIPNSSLTGFSKVAAEDFDGDGALDLAGTDTYDQLVGVMHGIGDGTFQPPVYFNAGHHPADLVVADFNGDGRPDVVTVSQSDNSVSLLLNNGGGGFQAPTTFGVGPQPSALAVGDFNGDGKPDIASANSGGNTLSVLINDGSGGFKAAVDLAALNQPSAVAVGDFNGDGKADLATVASGGAAVLLGIGNGTFQPPLHYDVASPAHGLVVGDFNRDGRTDIALGLTATGASWMWGSDTGDYWLNHYGVYDGFYVSFLEGRGDGTFTFAGNVFASEALIYETDILQPADTFSYDPPPDETAYVAALIRADFDVNGARDVAVVDSFGGVSALINDAAPSTPPSVTINNVSVTEGNKGTTSAAFTVSLSAASTSSVTVQYTTANGTATAGSDYQAAAGTLTFAPGETSKTVNELVQGDRVPEPNETFSVNLTNPLNATAANGQGVGTIVDDEPRISISDVAKLEGKKGETTRFVFIVTLSAAYDQPVTMSFHTLDATAKTSDQDYVAQAGTLTFAPGQTTKTISIVVNGDSKKEADETFYVDLYGNSSNSLFTKNRGIGTILNDD